MKNDKELILETKSLIKDTNPVYYPVNVTSIMNTTHVFLNI